MIADESELQHQLLTLISVKENCIVWAEKDRGKPFKEKPNFLIGISAILNLDYTRRIDETHS